jgi:hypothetical protein
MGDQMRVKVYSIIFKPILSSFPELSSDKSRDHLSRRSKSKGIRNQKYAKNKAFGDAGD